jgi:hypothetical protein
MYRIFGSRFRIPANGSGHDISRSVRPPKIECLLYGRVTLVDLVIAEAR